MIKYSSALWLLLALVVCIEPIFLHSAQAGPPTPKLSEYQAKASFLYNFAKFVTWPGNSPSQALCIGVLGESPFDQALSSLEGTTVQKKRVEVKKLNDLAAAEDCQLIFISRSEKSRLPLILQSLQGKPVLTVSDIDGFSYAGGMIELITQRNRIRFRINLDPVKTSGLSIGSRLLQLATNASELEREQLY